MNRKRVFFYVQHLLGIGHLKRAATLARALAAEGLQVTLASGGAVVPTMTVDKVKFVDYLSGDDAYKRDWMSHRRERWGILAFNLRTPRGAIAAARHVGARAVKRAVGVFSRLRRAKT